MAPGWGWSILGKISKRGNRYLRVLFVRAAWVVLIKPKRWDRHGLKPWLEAAKKRLHHDVLAIALANKLALRSRGGFCARAVRRHNGVIFSPRS